MQVIVYVLYPTATENAKAQQQQQAAAEWGSATTAWRVILYIQYPTYALCTRCKDAVV